MAYVYFVGYTFRDDDGKVGGGNSEVSSPRPIKTKDEINSLGEHVCGGISRRRSTSFEWFTVTGFSLLREE